mgnify:CR=1 FL=1|tara:strand:- start:2165 stop:3226 length:1062 start_codon:yes stop_codon:yes gene_type:complete
MKFFKTYKQFINEGGWSTVKTQATILNPLAIKKTVGVLKKVNRQFNRYLESIDLPKMDFGQPVGSGSWWQDDLANYPDKLYGDVDVLTIYPTLKVHGENKKKNEAESIRIYNDELMNWLEKERPRGIDPEETRLISNPNTVHLVVIIDADGQEGYVQVDLVASHAEYKDWALSRLTPIRNVKGFILGNMYSAFGDILNLSVQLKGVRAKVKDGILFPYSKRAGVEEILVSGNIKTFLFDIAKFFWEQSSDKSFKPTKDLLTWKMDTAHPTMEELYGGIKALANTLDLLDEFGGSVKYKTKEEFLKAIIKRYEEKMMKMFNSSKFNKAESEQAKKTVVKIRKMINNHIKLVKSL